MPSRDIVRTAITFAQYAMKEVKTTDNAFLKANTTTIRRNIIKFRAKTLPRPPKINSEINSEFLHYDEFLIADIKMVTYMHMVMSTYFQLNLLKQSRMWFLDGSCDRSGAKF